MVGHYWGGSGGRGQNQDEGREEPHLHRAQTVNG